MLVAASTVVDLARLQFATTSIYHFLFVPLTLGLGPLVAVMQTLWMRTKDERWLRLTHFFGTLLLINIAIAVATGLVQEFEFGMNWSVYSKFVGRSARWTAPQAACAFTPVIVFPPRNWTTAAPRPIVAIVPLSLYSNCFGSLLAILSAIASPACSPDWSATDPSCGRTCPASSSVIAAMSPTT